MADNEKTQFGEYDSEAPADALPDFDAEEIHEDSIPEEVQE